MSDLLDRSSSSISSGRDNPKIFADTNSLNIELDECNMKWRGLYTHGITRDGSSRMWLTDMAGAIVEQIMCGGENDPELRWVWQPYQDMLCSKHAFDVYGIGNYVICDASPIDLIFSIPRGGYSEDLPDDVTIPPEFRYRYAKSVCSGLQYVVIHPQAHMHIMDELAQVHAYGLQNGVRYE